ncbi:MAG: UDP-2,3-diacylglucosamine diphosphatase LpxI [Akkermansia sp.]|nr:UDP-2,3-diacylglucosamine diphosphatase LpxI [Akkermansia sp.]
MAQETPERTLGVIAGAGDYPRMVMESARRAGVRVVCIALRGLAEKGLDSLADAYAEFRVGELEKGTRYAKAHGVTELMLCGQVKPSCIYTMWPDAAVRRLLAGLDRRNAHTMFGALCNYFAEQGITVLPSTTFMEDHLPAAGLLAGPEPSPQQQAEAADGMRLAREIARLDIGQSIVVQGGRVVCVEAFKGTNECIESSAAAGGDCPTTLCKVTKPGHDMRFDVPCIGAATIRRCVAAGVRQVVMEAGRTILFDREEVLRLCNESGISLRAVELPQGEPQPLRRVQDDAEHARLMAREVARLGIGRCAVVCDGVVIAVEDAEGPEKCIRRAGEYMGRLRLARMLNWLLRLFTGAAAAPPAPILLATAGGFSLPPAQLRAASKAGIRVVRENP